MASRQHTAVLLFIFSNAAAAVLDQTPAGRMVQSLAAPWSDGLTSTVNPLPLAAFLFTLNSASSHLLSITSCYSGREVLEGKPLQQLRVLAVDDDRSGLRLLKQQLHLCNYNNAAAWDMLRERKGRDDQFDLVISDIFMVDGGIDGLKLLEHVSLEMDIPVIRSGDPYGSMQLRP
nr:unnamed protein product [Digitaria exilis]